MRAVVLLILAAGCGSTSGLVGPRGETKIDLSAYRYLVIGTFLDKVTEAADPDHRAEKHEEMRRVSEAFAMRILNATAEVDVFESVTSGQAARGETLKIAGTITRFHAGRRGVRAMGGLGAGTSYFDATVEVRDAASDVLLARMTVDRNSLPIVGGIARIQTVSAFMKSAARKLARELYRAKTGEHFQP